MSQKRFVALRTPIIVLPSTIRGATSNIGNAVTRVCSRPSDVVANPDAVFSCDRNRTIGLVLLDCQTGVFEQAKGNEHPTAVRFDVGGDAEIN